MAPLASEQAAASPGQAVAPGQLVGRADEMLGGRGTYVEDGLLFASVCGELVLADGGTALEVVAVDSAVPGAVPEVGATVVARVVRMSQERAECTIVAVGDRPLSEAFRGVIRRQDIRFFEVDKIQIIECFRVGDFVRARVLALGDARSYVLSTAVADDLGVVMARGANGASLEPVSWQYMKCPLTGALEKRKVAKPG